MHRGGSLSHLCAPNNILLKDGQTNRKAEAASNRFAGLCGREHSGPSDLRAVVCKSQGVS